MKKIRDRFDLPWRPAYEAWSAAAWTLSMLITILMVKNFDVATGPFLFVIFTTAVFSVWCWYESFTIWNRRANLAGRGLAWVTAGEVARWAKKITVFEKTFRKLFLFQPRVEKLWMGYGFEWKPRHVQSAYEVQKDGHDTFAPPKWYQHFRRITGKTNGEQLLGSPWIHGIEGEEEKISMPLDDLANQTLIFGTTGSGKTRLFELLVTQAIHRGETVVVLDPKGDADLRKRMQVECDRAGRNESFLFFHPAFPEMSIRLDPLKNWNRVTELASRISALLSSEGGRDAFKDFAWRSIDIIAAGLVYVEEQPNLKSFRRYIETGIEPLVERTLKKYLNEKVENWESLAKALTGTGSKRGRNKWQSDELVSLIELYKKEIEERPKLSSEIINGLINMSQHDREHLGKMLTSLVPVLSMLTSGHLGQLLSPDASDAVDPRPLMDSKKLLSGRHVIYIGLDSLPDAIVAGALGSLLLADLTSVAGSIYNFGGGSGIINIFCDEASEIVNEPFAQLLNKSRGAGYRIYFAAQTFPDFIAKTGNEPLARQLLGNAGNLYALRTLDRPTQDFIIETFGQATIAKIQHSQSTNAIGFDQDVTTSSGGYGERVTEEDVDKVSTDILGKLPNLEYFARVSGGRIVKMRLPLIKGKCEAKLEDQFWIKNATKKAM